MFMAVQPQSNDEAESESAHKRWPPVPGRKRRCRQGFFVLPPVQQPPILAQRQAVEQEQVKQEHDRQVPSEGRSRRGRRGADFPALDNPIVVSQAHGDVSRQASTAAKTKGYDDPTKQRSTSSSTEQASAGCLPLIRKSFQMQNVSQQATEILMASWREGTRKQYSGYLERWLRFCRQGQVDPICPPVNTVLDFLAELYHSGLGYSALNTARSALSATVVTNNSTTVGNHPLICRFLRGVFQLRPPPTKYTEVWDVTKETISKWIKQVLSNSGIDVSVFKPHSTRSAAVSVAKRADVTINDILKTAGWSTESTFAKYYDKAIVIPATESFASAVLQL
ncbi:uncharacterized protein LOC119735825 [Patiria miniata]|uniref:Core-binding (CB) domain-containing protein n=1 Tax=Patiria miniata TaxID=46514 RepID=A0A914ANT7_PATMI|nr:uncharacterized protein LOC119735825 [Patiria miniata]